jgi:hypothetical protein
MMINPYDISGHKRPPKVGRSGEITAELLQQVADRVYAMWLKEVKIENERRRSVGGQRYPRR